jgi:AraC-like DNA-binding protein
LSVGDIAFFLQYSEPTAFHRAFHRWTGQTPREFREATIGHASRSAT